MAKKKPTLPSRQDLLDLPFWPGVAFAARAGRRLLPLVAHCWETKIPPDAKYLGKAGHLRGTRRCVRQTELAAANAGVVDEQALYDARDTAAGSSGQASYAAELAGRKKGAKQYAASYAASVIHAAATLAFRRLKPDWNWEIGNLIIFTDDAGKAFGASAAVNAAFRADFDRIRRLVDEKGWTDETPVRPSVFGPLWPDGMPAGWPEKG